MSGYIIMKLHLKLKKYDISVVIFPFINLQKNSSWITARWSWNVSATSKMLLAMTDVHCFLFILHHAIPMRYFVLELQEYV